MNTIEKKNYQKYRNLVIRLETVILLGKKCVRCGFDDWRALQVDHVNGDGHADRKIRNQLVLLEQVRQDVSNGTGIFQLLCANCNWIKRYEKDEHGGNRWLKCQNSEHLIES